MQRHSMRALACRTTVTLTTLPLLAKAVALLIQLTVISYLAGFSTLAGGTLAGAGLLLLNACIDRAMAGSNGHE